jgi:hypothetical protein
VYVYELYNYAKTLIIYLLLEKIFSLTEVKNMYKSL